MELKCVLGWGSGGTAEPCRSGGRQSQGGGWCWCGWTGGAMLGQAQAGLGTAGWDTAAMLVPAQVCPCSRTELCAEMSRIPCLHLL